MPKRQSTQTDDAAAKEQDGDVDFGSDAATPEQPLETKYREQMRQIMPQKIELPITALKSMIEKQIKLDPEFQRRDRWDVEKQSRFIESIIMNVPIPPVFLGEDEYGNYTVLDGRQRLTAVYDFLRNTYALHGLKVWSELNKSRYTDLEKKGLDRAILRRFIPAVIILKESSPEVKYDVFDRLNTGGVVALPMEIRNAVYPGAFNRLLHNLSENDTFLRLWDIPKSGDERLQNRLYSRMGDLELVLRFFALREADTMELRFVDYLGEFMDTRNKAYAKNPDLAALDTNAFQAAVTNAWYVFGETAFRKPRQDGTFSIKSAPLADAVMVGLSEIESENLNDELKQRIQEGFKKLSLENDDFIKATSTATNGKGAIRTRIGLAREMLNHIVANH